MTTAASPSRASFAGSVVGRALVVTCLLGLVAAGTGALVGGAPAAFGALVGAALVCGFFAGGGAVLTVVSRVAAAASLLVALLTYTLQVLVVGLVFVALRRSEALDRSVDSGWLAGTVILGTFVWLSAQVLFTVRARHPVYDVPSHGQEASVR